LAASELEAVRKLPVTMLFPLTLLILPGFLLVAIAPAILDAFSRLELSP
jgi:pilus assembly protein TadC